MTRKTAMMLASAAIVVANGLARTGTAAAEQPCTWATVPVDVCPGMSGWFCATRFPACGEPIYADCTMQGSNPGGIVGCYWTEGA